MAIDNGVAGLAPAHRCFTYPLSHADQQLRASPFAIRQSDSQVLESSEAFQIIRRLFSNQQDSWWVMYRHTSPMLHLNQQSGFAKATSP